MKFYDLDQSIARLVEVEMFVRELAAREDEIATSGFFKRIPRWPSYEKAEATLRDFDNFLADILEFVRATDKATWEAVKSVIESAKLGENLSRIYVLFKSERRLPPVRQALVTVLKVLSASVSLGPKKHVFADSELPIQEILVALHRLISLVRRTHSLYLERGRVDDEIFKPSNIDRALVISYIEAAIVNIQGAPLAADEKAKLLEYLEHTKVELVDKDASWKKIVGALVIVATLLNRIHFENWSFLE